MLGIFGSIARSFAPQETRSVAGVPSGGLIPPLGSVPSASGLLISQATAMTVAAVYRAVAIRARDVARCPPMLFTEAADGTRTKIRPKDHPVAKLLRKPNRAQTWFEFVRDMWIGYLLRGNAYAAIRRNARGEPIELIPINPDAVLVLEAADGSWYYNVNRIGLFQIAMLRDFPVAIPAEDIIHVRGIAFNILVGASTIGLGRDTIGAAMGLSQQQSRWLANGARPTGVLQTTGRLSDDAAKRLKTQFQQNAGGIQNIGTTIVLEEGLSWKQVSLNSVDLQYIEQCNLSVQDVARLFDVPPRKLMQPDQTRGSTIIQEEQDYVNNTVAPDLDMFEQKLVDSFDLDDDGCGVDLDESAILRADPLTRYNLGRIGVLSGLTSTNEWRRSERLPPVPGGDEVRAPVNLAELGSDLTGTAPDGAGKPQDGTVPDEGKPTRRPRQPKPKPSAEDDPGAAAPEG